VTSRAREPVFNIPGVVVGIILVLAGIHAARAWWLGDVGLIWDFSFIPVRAALLFGVDPIPELTARLAVDPGNVELAQQLAFARELVSEDDAKPWTFFTYAFLHGSWTHLILNAIWLLAFGAAVARRIGTWRFLALFAVTALGGSLAHLATHPLDVLPMIGASGAISGFMAAAIRFVFQPGAPLGIYRLGEEDSYRVPLVPLPEAFRDRRVVIFLVIWFVMNLGTGLAGTSFGMTDATIAWQAHIGGFVAGLLVFPWLDRPLRAKQVPLA
jgi:membrane associated rhomboid family serine protease